MPTLDAETLPWLVRPYDAAQDEAGLHYLLGVSYARSRAGVRAGASRAGGSTTPKERSGAGPDPAAVTAQKAFLAAHRPVWAWLLEHADVSLAVDPEAPHIVWGWLLTSGPSVIHAVGCKRAAAEAGISVELVRDLLGSRLATHQVCTLELPQMRTRGAGSVGLDRPKEWSMDPTWLLTRMLAR